MKRKRQREEIRRPEEATKKPHPRQFSAPECSLCRNVRPQFTNYSKVYGTIKREFGVVRYIRCNFCGNSWTVTITDNSARVEIPPEIETNDESKDL